MSVKFECFNLMITFWDGKLLFGINQEIQDREFGRNSKLLVLVFVVLSNFGGLSYIVGLLLL